MTPPRPDALIVFMPVRDLDATHRFYGELLGLPLVLDQGTCRIYRVAGAGHVGFCRRPNARPVEGLMVTLVTEEVETWHRALVAAGVPVDGPPRHNRQYDIVQFFAIDPDGWTVEVQRFADPRWSAAAPSA